MGSSTTAVLDPRHFRRSATAAWCVRRVVTWCKLALDGRFAFHRSTACEVGIYTRSTTLDRNAAAVWV